MAFVAASSTRILTGPFALSAYATQVSAGVERGMIERTAFTDTDRVYIVGQKSHSLSVEAMLDSSTGTGTEWDTLTGFFSAGTQVPVTVAPAGFTAGNAVWMADAFQMTAGLGNSVAEGVNVSLAWQTSGAAGLGQSVFDLTAVSATASSAAVDGGAASSNGGVAHLHVTAVSGSTPTCDVIIEHSVNGSSSWATLATFAQVTTSTSGQSVSVAAGTTVRRYLRATYTIAGTNPSYTLAVAFARS